MGRMNREWLQGRLHGTKPLTPPAPLIYQPRDQLHSAGTFCLQRENNQPRFSWFQRFPSQIKACATALLVACPSDFCCPSCWPLCHSHPRTPRTRGPQVLLSFVCRCGHRTRQTSAETSHPPLHPFPFYLSVHSGGACPIQQ